MLSRSTRPFTLYCKPSLILNTLWRSSPVGRRNIIVSNSETAHTSKNLNPPLAFALDIVCDLVRI